MRYAPKRGDPPERGDAVGGGAWGVWDGRLARWAEAPRLASQSVAQFLADELNRKDQDEARWDRLRRGRQPR